ncbi:FtsX-like permease family protein [Niveispirillum sp. BGYR6]|uniref:ABC transporter permease n=1 Tax=Niveispirillum sp. BGYR6 TaxID=2971249 RepID=UPI0022B9BA98|nr:FtsX-like permease family protein [Niveispirillum sp. BGYR6]MDG5497607.1 ABC transporter permease [Niveispirillum sp. BGYR6]
MSVTTLPGQATGGRPAAGPLGQLAMALRIARRELRGGLSGFRIFIACLAIGVAAIAAVQSISAGITDSLQSDGRAILGGDVSARILYREATPEQLRWLAERGEVLTSAEMRAMARDPADSGQSALVELKSVGPAYPLYGQFQIQGPDGEPQTVDVQSLLAARDGTFGAVIEDTLATRLDLKTGAKVAVGELTLEVRGIIAAEPDKAGSGSFSLGPRMMVSEAALKQTGLIQQGSLITWSYQVKLNNGVTVDQFRDQAKAEMADANWRLRDYTNAAPGLTRFIDRLALFLTLVGLTALLVGGVGVGNAVRAYMDTKSATIATLKCLGAPGALIFQVYLIQILVLASVGIVLGLIVGAIVPLLTGQALAGLLPITARIGLYPGALAIAAGFGYLTALCFSLWPLGRARQVPAVALFRDLVQKAHGRPGAAYLAGIALSGLALAGLAVGTAREQLFAAGFVVGSLLVLAAFWGAGWLITRGARALGRPKRPVLRLALTNIHRPGNPTSAVVLSLGLGLTVLVAIALIEGNFRREVQEKLPVDAPSFFFVDIQGDQADTFRQTVLSVPGAHDLNMVPNLRGRIVAVNGVEAEKAVKDKANAWVLNGDRGVTYQAVAPKDDVVLAGQWWPADYQGPPKLAIYKDIATTFGIGPGDRMTLNILGRDIEGEVAVVREIDWESIGINFTLIFSPGVLEAAPQTYLATIKADPASEATIQREVARRFSNISAVRVKDALETISGILGNVGVAVRLTAAVTLAAGTLVLAGAIAAGHRRRVYDAVVLKVLGATRGTVLRAFLLEYGLLGLVTSAFAGLLGTLVAWAVLTKVMDFGFTFLPQSVLFTTLLCTGITLTLGFIGTWRALGQPAAPLLRND